jgi:small subunit ribosomal protein S20
LLIVDSLQSVPYLLYFLSMPIIKSAKKRVRVAARARARNVRTKRSLRESLKAFSKAVEAGKPADILKAQNEAYSALDTAVKKAVLHRNKAARQKAALAARAKAAGVKPASSQKPKPTSQKPKAKSQKPAAAKKTASTPKTAKKPATKKPVSKK